MHHPCRERECSDKRTDYKQSNIKLSVYVNKAKEIGELVTQKQMQYGDSFHNAGDVLRKLYPNGIELKDYDNVLVVARIIDKLFRVANGDKGNESAFADIAGYGILGATKKESVKI